MISCLCIDISQEYYVVPPSFHSASGNLYYRFKNQDVSFTCKWCSVIASCADWPELLAVYVLLWFI